MDKLNVLVVEDEWLIAEDLKTSLEDLGCRVLGPAPSCAAALEIIWREKPDLAYVDTRLGSDTCEAVLEECERQGVSVIISSGHAEQELPAFASGRPLIAKPYRFADIESSLAHYRGVA